MMKVYLAVAASALSMAIAAPASAHDDYGRGSHYDLHEQLAYQHDRTHERLEAEHDAAHDYRWMTPRQHRRLHRSLERQHERADHRLSHEHEDAHYDGW